MADVVVTCPKWFWENWIDEGALPGEYCPPGVEYDFYLGGPRPTIQPGERVYVVAHGKLRGYAPLVRLQPGRGNRWSLVRRGGAVAVTVPDPIPGFRGWKYRWWHRSQERPFPLWQWP